MDKKTEFAVKEQNNKQHRVLDAHKSDQMWLSKLKSCLILVGSTNYSVPAMHMMETCSQVL